MKKERSYNDINHFYGRIFLSIALLIIIGIPITMAIVLKAKPEFLVILKKQLSVLKIPLWRLTNQYGLTKDVSRRNTYQKLGMQSLLCEKQN